MTASSATSVPDQLVLASASPRRQALLAQLGLHVKVLPVTIDERPQSGEMPTQYVTRLARAKAKAAAGRCSGLPILGADTVMVIDDQMLGKPVDRTAGLAMLAQLSGRAHQVMSAVCLITPDLEETCFSVTTVWFRNITAPERAAYWATGEPIDKAGGYAIQGLGAVFVTALHGSYSGVVGLPLFEAARLLEKVGITVIA